MFKQNMFAKFFGVMIIGLALAIAIIPQYTDCNSQGKKITLANGRQIDMKCHWTAEGELATAVPMVGVGAMMAASRKKETLRNMGLMGMTLGIFAIMLPTRLIGVCATPSMLCHSVMKPSLVSLGATVVGFSFFGLVLSQWNRKKDELS